MRLSVEDRGQLESLVAKGKAAARKLTPARILLKADGSPLGPAWSDEQISDALDLRAITVHRVRRSFVEAGLEGVPSSGVRYRVARDCSMATTRPTSSPWPAQAHRRAGAAGRSVSWPANWSNSAMSPRSRMRPFAERSKKRVEAVAGQDVVHPAPGQRRVRLEDGGCPPCLQASV